MRTKNPKKARGLGKVKIARTMDIQDISGAQDISAMQDISGMTQAGTVPDVSCAAQPAGPSQIPGAAAAEDAKSVRGVAPETAGPVPKKGRARRAGEEKKGPVLARAGMYLIRGSGKVSMARVWQKRRKRADHALTLLRTGIRVLNAMDRKTIFRNP